MFPELLAFLSSLIGIILFLRLTAQEARWLSLIKSRKIPKQRSGWTVPWSIVSFQGTGFICAQLILMPEKCGTETVFVTMSPDEGITAYIDDDDRCKLRDQDSPGWWLTIHDLRACEILPFTALNSTQLSYA